jgi:hypothetical protein
MFFETENPDKVRLNEVQSLTGCLNHVAQIYLFLLSFNFRPIAGIFRNKKLLHLPNVNELKEPNVWKGSISMKSVGFRFVTT